MNAPDNGENNETAKHLGLNEVTLRMKKPYSGIYRRDSNGTPSKLEKLLYENLLYSGGKVIKS